MSLPVEEILPQLRETLAHGHAVLSSPPGSGKTTRVPLALLNAPWLNGQKIIMLEPRRPAARMAARYMAHLLDEDVGDTVGYQVRMERRIGKRTRIEVLTEGLLVRRMQADPELPGVGLIIFDEFHERSLQADLGLALSLDVCASLREDLRLLVMSATLDERAVADLMEGDVVSSGGGLFPVERRHLDKSAGRDILPATQRLVLQACREQQGDLLVFLPGKGEMNRLEDNLRYAALQHEILQLHGEMDAAAQAKILTPGKHHAPRIVLATDVAETSLTIEGITTVVDTGLTRKPVFDPDSGLSRLRVLPISRASADQRAGRAGRLGPGVCYRAWTEAEQRARPAQRPAEICQADLAPLVLELALWGVPDPASLQWLDKPPKAAWNQAVALLQELEALDHAGRITAHGKRLAVLGLHPRLAHLLVRGGGANRLAADIAALLSDRDPWRHRPGQARPADLGLRLQAMEVMRAKRKPDSGVDGGKLRQLLRLSDRLYRQCRQLPPAENDLSAGALLSLAYPERIARRRAAGGGRYLMASGSGAVLPLDDGLVTADYLAIAHMDAGSREGRIWLAMAVDTAELQALHGDQICATEELVWDEQRQRVVARKATMLGALQLSAREMKVSEKTEVTKVLLQVIRSKGLDCLPWRASARQLQARIALAAKLDEKGGWPDVSGEYLSSALETWLAPWLEGKRTMQDVKQLDLHGILQSMLDWEQLQRLNRLLPERWPLPDGSSAAIDYLSDPPVLAVPLQLMFGVARTPAVFQERQPLLLHLLSPAGRPLQVTTDLAHFWSHAWEQVKKEMRGRYPKHQWPDDPVNARPVRLKRQL
ncbi:ATP-dependent helicase HrpB [Thiolapillus sp.]